MSSVVSGFRRFAALAHASENATTAMWYLALRVRHDHLPRPVTDHRLPARHITASSAVYYAYLLQKAYNFDDPMFPIFRTALSRLAALDTESIRQAPPLSALDVRRAARRALVMGDRRMCIALRWAWLTAARGADLRVLRLRHIERSDAGSIVIKFYHTKSDSAGEGAFVGLPPDESLLEDFDWLRANTSPDEPIFPFSNGEISRLLGSPAHGIRRGALTHLINDDTSAIDAMAVSRHATYKGFCRYVPMARSRLAEHLARTTIKLLRALSQ